MEKIKPIEIPESHMAFASAVAKLAKENFIESFEMTYRPHSTHNGGQQWDRQLVVGDATIRFSDRDGRGRPCENLSIEVSSRTCHQIKRTDESFS